MMNEHFTYTRRFFLQNGACALCAGAMGSILSSCDSVQEGEPLIDLAKEERLQKIGGAIRRRFAAVNNGEAIFVIREGDNSFIAYAAQCTHQQVELNLPKEGTIKCPNHGSLFRVSDGSVIDGKAYAPLKRYAVDYDAATLRLRILPSQTDMT
jgi:nitrite reductase/ring-hydroxylating ferredoxin subunit